MSEAKAHDAEKLAEDIASRERQLVYIKKTGLAGFIAFCCSTTLIFTEQYRHLQFLPMWAFSVYLIQSTFDFLKDKSAFPMNWSRLALLIFRRERFWRAAEVYQRRADSKGRLEAKRKERAAQREIEAQERRKAFRIVS